MIHKEEFKECEISQKTFPLSLSKECFFSGKNGKSSLEMFQQYKQLILKIVQENQSIAREENYYKDSGIFSIEDFENKFSITGNVRIKNKEFEDVIQNDPVLENFFNEDRIFRKNPLDNENQGEVHLNGYRYIVSLDPNVSVERKIEILSRDLLDALAIIEKVQEQEIEITRENRLFYVAVFQYATNAAVTLFNAFIIHEKLSQFNIDNSEYLEWRTFMEHVIEYVTNSLCYLFVGDQIPPPREGSIFNIEEIPEFSKRLVKDKKTYHFQRPESTELVRILTSCYLFAKDNPDLNTIVNMPSGGTQISYILNWVYQNMYKKKCALIHQSVSLHSIKEIKGNKPGDQSSVANEQYYLNTRKGKIRGKVIGGIDDNSSTGSTLERVRESLLEKEAKKVVLGVVEADIRRSEMNLFSDKNIASLEVYKYCSAQLPVSKIYNPKHDLKELKELQILVRKYEDLLESVDNDIDFIKYFIMLDNIQNPVQESDLYKENTIFDFKCSFLSNFSSVSVGLDGHYYPSVENAYIASKYKGVDIGTCVNKRMIAYMNDKLTEGNEDFKITSENIGEELFSDSRLTPRDAVMISRELEKKGLCRQEWPKVRIGIMIELLLQKFMENLDYRQDLLDTGDAQLIEGNDWGDVFWGYDRELKRGNNFLGRILMYIRDNLLLKMEEKISDTER